MAFSCRLCLTLLVLILPSAVSYCLEPLPPCHPVLLAANRLTVLADDPALSSVNPVAGETGISSATSFIYSMKSLEQFGLASIAEYGKAGVFSNWQTLNNDDYQRQDYQIGVRYKLSKLRAGIGYRFMYDKIPGYGSEKDRQLYAGARYRHKSLIIDASAQRAYKDDPAGENEPEIYSLVMGQEVTTNSTLAGGLVFARHSSPDLLLGCRLDLYDNLMGLVSWSNRTGRFGIGAGFRTEWLQISYALLTHPDLDLTHSVGISILMPAR